MNKASDTQGVATVDMWVAGKRRRATATRLGDITNPATGEVAAQVAWAAGLLLLGRLVLSRATRKLVVQGG